MHKNYLPLIALLTIIAIFVSSVAVYKSFLSERSEPKNEKPVVLSANTSRPSPTPIPSPLPSPIPTVSLTIDSPIQNASVSSSLLSIKGSTATTAAVTVNDKPLRLNPDGSFKSSLRLSTGPNLLVIQASDSGAFSVWQTVVTYAP